MSANNFADLWNELKAEAVAEVAKLKADAVALEKSIVPVVEADIATVLSQFKTLAIQMVLQMAQGGLAAATGAEKQGVVITSVFQAAEAAGKQIAIQDAQMLAQQAFTAVATALKPA
jgi:hypothetical protein